MRNLRVETGLNMAAGVMSVAGKKRNKVIVLVILISKDNWD
jgi:hypothetical protein